MRRVKSRLLVIDASVLQSAGGVGQTSWSSAALRDLLIRVRGVCHRVAVSAEILEEWDRHQSAFARQWRTSMAQIGKVVSVSLPAESAIQTAIDGLGDPAIQAILKKDLRLVEAALVADKIILSLDKKAHGHYRALVPTTRALSTIHWVNPAANCEEVLIWLETGAKARAEFQLGHRRK